MQARQNLLQSPLEHSNPLRRVQGLLQPNYDCAGVVFGCPRALNSRLKLRGGVTGCMFLFFHYACQPINVSTSYIPPPVLDALDSTSIETTRRAALLTAALTWFFTNLPVNVLPITVRPVIVILQGLVPYLGYLGGILSWSWGTIRSYDEGAFFFSRRQVM